jgi:hypothetical protein
MREPAFVIGQDLVKLIAEIDEFNGRWDALKTLSPDRLNALRKVATVESIGSSTRIEGAARAINRPNATEVDHQLPSNQLKIGH